MDSKTVMIIEDNPLNMKLVVALLKMGNYHVLEATNAEEGLEIIRQNRPDLVLMDIQLPGMDGLSATRLLKGDGELKDIPVVALTSYAMQGDAERTEEAGCSGYIPKPIETRTFLETIATYLSHGR